MEKAKIFQSIVKGSNFFTPIVDSYHTIGNHIIELNSPRCHNCERRGTMDCPVSYMCYSTKDKPYFKSRHNGK